MSGSTDPSGTGPHQNQPVASAGAPLEDASAVVILMYGSGEPLDEWVSPGFAYS